MKILTVVLFPLAFLATAQGGSTSVTAQSPASIVTATTNTAQNTSIRGTFEITTGGTIQPAITLGTSLGAGAVSLMICRDIGSIGPTIVNIPASRKLSDPGVRLYDGTCLLHCVLASAVTATFFNGELAVMEK